MPNKSLDTVKVGDELPEHVSPEITRHALALFCGASGDHNPMHVDMDFARTFGAPDVFAHGMLSMAYLAQLLTHWIPQARIRSWGVRFLAITPIHVKVICTGRVVEILQAEGERRARLELSARTDAGEQTLLGEAVIGVS
jgi:acyl dehydratase